MRGDVRLALCALLISCGREPAHEPSPPAAAAAPTQAPVLEEAPAPPPAGIDHTVIAGQRLWDIARAYHVSVRAILDANHLAPDAARRLRNGQVLRIPGATQVADVTGATPSEEPEALPPVTDGAYHRLGPGETLWDVAHLYEVSIDSIIERNGLDDEGVRLLRPGRALIVPGVTERQVERATRNRAETDHQTHGFRHTLERGETIWDLASSFGVPVSAIMAGNALDEASVRNLRDGAQLYIPGVERDVSGRVHRRLGAAEQRALQVARTLGLGTRDVARALLHGHVQPQWARAAAHGRARTLPGTLRWPVSRGWFVRGFGSGEGGYHLAMDIMGRIGWNVRAAAAGIVGYSGDEVPGYGNIVLVIHPGGWVTMYAHNSANLVVAGQRVPAGAILAEVGSTGISRGPHVHFELMYDGRNCDPALLFRPGVRHMDGHVSPLHYTPWTDPDSPPAGLHCYPRRRHPHSRWVVHESFDETAAGE